MQKSKHIKLHLLLLLCFLAICFFGTFTKKKKKQKQAPDYVPPAETVETIENTYFGKETEPDYIVDGNEGSVNIPRIQIKIYKAATPDERQVMAIEMQGGGVDAEEVSVDVPKQAVNMKAGARSELLPPDFLKVLICIYFFLKFPLHTFFLCAFCFKRKKNKKTKA